VKKLISDFKKLDGLYRVGIIFLVLFITPMLTALVIDIINNGTKLS
tara:strand:+ start:16562 stop:16699 length:138 start_codon:yes stop_codon:yes gene_type:complete